MKREHGQQLKSLRHRASEYGYVALRDCKQHHYLTLLPKIIKLKTTNRTLCSKRKVLLEDIFTKSQSNGWFVAITLLTLEVVKLSEQIGKNSCKIQQMRTQYCKYSDKWVGKKHV